MEHVVQRREDDRSLSQLFSDATRETSDLIRKEIELAKLEIVENISRLESGVFSMAIALPLLFGGFLVLLFAAVAGVDRALGQLWLSALIVGAAVSVMGLIALAVGRHQVKQVDLTPDQSAESLRKDKEMLQRRVGAR